METMRVFATIDDPRLPLAEVGAYARRAERLGFSGLLVPEAVHDGFLMALLALEHTSSLQVATSVIVAFPRSPATVAYAAWDLQSLSGGRFVLGLGSQVKGNIVGRFGVEWKPPVARMRDYVGAVRAMWRTWQDGVPLNFDSEHYRLDRMQPFFNPGPIEAPRIPILLGGVNEGMMKLAGALSDGVMTHPTNTSPRYLRERLLPAVRRGVESAGRAAGAVEVLASTFVAAGRDDAAVQRERERLREILAFVYSTPQYWPTLELHGWEDVGPRLRQLTRDGEWQRMKDVVTDEVLDALVPAAPYDDLAAMLEQWYEGLVAAITLRMPDDPKDDPAFGRLVDRIQSQ